MHCKSIRIWDGDIGDEGVRAIHQYIIDTNNPKVELIEFLNCGIGPLGCEFISRMLNPLLSTNISILTLDYNEFGNEGLYNLMLYCKSNKTLKYLSLNYCRIDENGIRYFQDFLTSTSVQLEVLNLQGNPLKNTGVSELIQLLFNNSSIEEINLNNVGFGNDKDIVQNLVGLILGNLKLIIYRFKYNFITDEGNRVIKI